ncbi:hypothetical protein GGX14DRAFT_358484, partial [Mycena pura]
GAYMLYPPYYCCPAASCSGRKLDNPVRAACRIYTLHRGVLPAYEVSLYCRGCWTRYHYAYYVTRPSERLAYRYYYKQELPYIQAHESSFLEVGLCEFFERTISISHTSTSDLAMIYNEKLAHLCETMRSPLLPTIAQTTILDGFFMHGLLRRAQRTNTELFALHNLPQETRLNEALEHYNQLMAGTGQPMYAHACHDCLKFFQDENSDLKYMRAATTDGVTLGHPCCVKWNCQTPLKHRGPDHFCPRHQQCATECRVLDCEQRAEQDFITCSLPEHRQEEVKMREHSQSSLVDFQRRTDKGNVPQTPRRKKRGGRSLYGSSTRRNYTHNEQLLVMCCGIIIARATFYTSEAVSSVKQFLKKIYPDPRMAPTHIFYDNACNLLKHLRAQNDTTFDLLVRFVVDVFHARKGHDDEFCNENTHPAAFPELRTMKDGKEAWAFNSSVAEQTNVWFGAFQSIVHEMSVPRRYNFFLDEMISLRNDRLLLNLARNGKQPFIQSCAVLEQGSNEDLA